MTDQSLGSIQRQDKSSLYLCPDESIVGGRTLFYLLFDLQILVGLMHGCTTANARSNHSSIASPDYP